MQITFEPNEFGGRLKYLAERADSNYWDRIWERTAPNWDRARRGHIAYQLRDTFLRWAKPGDRILEAGCGLALFTVAAHARGFDAEGMDWSSSTIQRLKSSFPHINFWQGDARSLEVADSVYDAIYSPGVCEHYVEGPGTVLGETFRVLKPGGVAIVSTPCFNSFLQHRQSTFPRLGEGDFYQYAFSPTEMTQHMKREGFDVVQVRPYAALETLIEHTVLDFPQGKLRRAATLVCDLIPRMRQWGRSCIWVGQKPA